MASEGFSDFFYAAPDGLKLHARIYGESNTDAWPVVCLPGLTRNARDFHELALYLSSKAKRPRKVVAFDYRGRGRSDYDPDISHYNVGVEAGDVLAGLSELGIEEAAFVGTSRGGLIIHVLGALKPAALKAIVLNDIGPVIEAEGLAHIRSYLDRNPKPKTFAEAVDAQRRVHGAGFPALTDADWARMVTAICRDTDAGWVPDFDPALVETLAGVDVTKPLPDLWPQFDALTAVPLLAIRGGNSTLLSAATFEEMQKRHPGMQTITVEGQGHAPFLETGTLPEEIAGFLDRAEREVVPK
ncbi:alpha/beta hydrolase [Mesorhizobium sp. WSM4904]|uniref:alpha/beta fold hydrolase n=1 Tax=Mesorhizobium sp. WSM4904 TaxID=3038545 RepID=UPI0024188448|nr:alpha/beta hydrolase [Mesorhizobium sp. WSM4904]WFP62033.1 alpha/beta hydrolase [Mesorhizobium sp. WSM4904]